MKSEVAVQLLRDVWQQGNFDKMSDLVVDDVQRHHPRYPALNSTQLLTMIQEYRIAFPDMTYKFLHSAETGENVSLLYEVTGTHLGSFGPIPPTGIRDTMTCLDFFRFREGKIAEIWTMFDELGMLIKMGVVPPFAS